MWEGFTDEVRPLHIFERVKHLEFRKSIREGQIDLRVFGTPERVRFSGGAELQLGEGDNDVDSDVDSDMIQRGNNHRLLEQRLRALLERLEKNTLLQFRYSIYHSRTFETRMLTNLAGMLETSSRPSCLVAAATYQLGNAD